MAIKTGKINMTEDIAIISRITDKDPSVSKSFRSLQGYTAAPDGSQLFAMIKSKNMNDDAKIGENATEVKLVEISYSNTDISSKTYTNLYHANDCTYYQNTYFVVTANNKKFILLTKIHLNKPAHMNIQEVIFLKSLVLHIFQAATFYLVKVIKLSFAIDHHLEILKK